MLDFDRSIFDFASRSVFTVGSTTRFTTRCTATFSKLFTITVQFQVASTILADLFQDIYSCSLNPSYLLALFEPYLVDFLLYSTVILGLPNFNPSKAFTALSACSSSVYSTKPKPF